VQQLMRAQLISIAVQGRPVATGPCAFPAPDTKGGLAHSLNPALEVPIVLLRATACHVSHVVLQSRPTDLCPSTTICMRGQAQESTCSLHWIYRAALWCLLLQMGVWVVALAVDDVHTAVQKQLGLACIFTGTAKAGTFNGFCSKCTGKGPKGGERYSPSRAATACLEWFV
jgi:hypothetical protein